jgi:predicted AlkP superfamily pyrophosphatase or phosphodiesterase
VARRSVVFCFLKKKNTPPTGHISLFVATWCGTLVGYFFMKKTCVAYALRVQPVGCAAFFLKQKKKKRVMTTPKNPLLTLPRHLGLSPIFPMRHIFATCCFCVVLAVLQAQTTPSPQLRRTDAAATPASPTALAAGVPRPKLVVGIVVDQMRYDYLYRYAAQYGPDGFRRLLREGLSCEQNNYDFVPTYTGPGHACVYTGTGPSLNGVIANEWFEAGWFMPRDGNPRGVEHRYVTADTTVRTVGSPNKSGWHSPRVLLSSTITDELRLATNFRSRVVGISLKDRGSILPAGHLPSACYWFDDQTGNFVTSTFYATTLPSWVQVFNEKKLAETYLNRKWDRDSTWRYSEAFADWASKNYDKGRYSTVLAGSKFPHDLAALRRKMGLGVLRFTPWGNTMTLDFALETIEQMQLGADEDTDFLCLSFSSPDYCAHQFGVHSVETEDMYLRLDRDIARLLRYLDQKFGKDNVLVFLTADHGGAETPTHLAQRGIPAGVFPEDSLYAPLTQALRQRWPQLRDTIIRDGCNQQIWLHRAKIEAAGVDFDAVASAAADWLRGQAGVYGAWPTSELMSLPADLPYVVEMRRGIHPKRSGHVVFMLEPAWHPDAIFSTGGTTHGSPYPYDTHVPLIWYGFGIRPGAVQARTSVRDIAPTLAALLHIMEPNASTGRAIEGVVR